MFHPAPPHADLQLPLPIWEEHVRLGVSLLPCLERRAQPQVPEACPSCPATLSFSIC